MDDKVLDRDDALDAIIEMLPEASDSFLLDLLDDLTREPALTISDNRDIVVTICPGLDKYDESFLQAIADEIGGVLVKLGFAGKMRMKRGHKVELVYWQFGEAT